MDTIHVIFSRHPSVFFLFHCLIIRKEKLHLCPMHKHKLTGAEQNKLETVAEAEVSTGGDCGSQVDCTRSSRSRLSTLAEADLSTVTCEPPPEWASEPSTLEKVKVVGEKVKVPPKSYKDVEFNL